jgi:hypothetical protein
MVKIRIAHLQRMSVVLRARSAKRRKGKMRKQRTGKYNLGTCILEITRREKQVRQ